MRSGLCTETISQCIVIAEGSRLFSYFVVVATLSTMKALLHAIVMTLALYVKNLLRFLQLT